MIETEVSRVANSSIEQVFVDPAGNHVLLLLKANGGYETHYLHRCAVRAGIARAS